MSKFALSLITVYNLHARNLLEGARFNRILVLQILPKSFLTEVKLRVWQNGASLKLVLKFCLDVPKIRLIIVLHSLTQRVPLYRWESPYIPLQRVLSMQVD